MPSGPTEEIAQCPCLADHVDDGRPAPVHCLITVTFAGALERWVELLAQDYGNHAVVVEGAG